jgi:hypothetical protein
MAADPNTPNVPRDWRAVIVIVAGLIVIVAIVVTTVLALPGDVPQGKVNTKGQSMVSIGSSAFTAVTAVIAAYFGVKAANLAREDAEKRGQDHAIQIAHLAGAAEPEQAGAAIKSALEEIKNLPR